MKDNVDGYIYWKYVRVINQTPYSKNFKLKVDALCWKFIIHLRLKSKQIKNGYK